MRLRRTIAGAKRYIGTVLGAALLLTGCGDTNAVQQAEEPVPYLVDESVAAPEWSDSYVAEPKAEGDLRVIQISDPHYYSMRLTDGCTLYKNSMAKAAGRDALHIGEILDAFSKQMQQYEPDVLVVTGDLTMNGAKASHEDFADYLRPFEEKGIRVLVLPGNHDINSNRAWEIRENTATITEGVTPEEFEKIYSEFGYREAIYRDTDSLSYVADLGENCWMLLLDASIYREEIVRPGGRLGKTTREWISNVLTEAAQKGIRVISASHQNLLVHNDNFISDYTILDGVSIVTEYLNAGVDINLSGHLHCMNIVSKQDRFYEVAMESISVWPNLYGQLDVRKDGTMSFSTHATEHASNSYAYMLDSTYQTLGRRLPEEGLTDQERTVMRDFVVQMNVAYFSGKLKSKEEYESEEGYRLWKEKAPGSSSFQFIESIVQGDRRDHTFIEEI